MKTLLNKALEVCDAVEIYRRTVSNVSVDMKFSEIQSVDSSLKTEIALRLIKGNQMGTAVATSLEDETLIERALTSLKHQNSEAVTFLNEPITEVMCYSEPLEALSLDAMVALVHRYNAIFSELDQTMDTAIGLEKTAKEVEILNSNGFNEVYRYTNLESSIGILNAQGFRSASQSFSKGNYYELNKSDFERVYHFHKLGETPIELGNEKMPVVFDGSVMGALMLRVLAGVNGGNVVKGLSPLTNRLGDKIFSKILTIRDDATYPYGCNSFRFDDEGTPAQNTVLVEKGILKGYLLNTKQAEKLGGLATGNSQKRNLFSKEIEDSPSIYDTNLIVEGVSIPDEDLIRGIKRGLFITGVMGAHTGNIIQGEFSLNISSGFLIEDGVFKGKVKGAMIAGNIYDLFQHVEAIGTDLKVMKSIFYNMGYAPMVLFKEAHIVGK
ncbi:TldD/PmbA family protein [Fusibacter tunisiensis]|jgi:PmbA protein|uniref:PmbA protein n=1 Tax=Fusibacter tunisiensis TaxID=1008308 RepID=A0ABS2MRT7_9FIRM|nr:metallopeptidase TldD-related protein [Fusibacter tunisiensis]MBM7562134.1 PmbA protein [Fusibacter tunisiensis]